MTEILEKSGNFMRGKKWEPCSLYHCLLVKRAKDKHLFHVSGTPSDQTNGTYLDDFELFSVWKKTPEGQPLAVSTSDICDEICGRCALDEPRPEMATGSDLPIECSICL